MTDSERSFTERGFTLWTIPNQDYRGGPTYRITVQESSLATERKVWVGPSDVEDAKREEFMRGTRMHLTEQAARGLRDALAQWLGED